MASPSPRPSETLHGGHVIAKKLRAEGVDTVFTLTGGHISPIYDGCAREGGIRFVDVRHEQAAAHAADAYARLNRRAAVAAVTAGPALTGAITAVANAFYAHSPLVLLAGRNPLSHEGLGTLQDAPHAELLRPVTKRVDVAYDAWRLGEVLHYAFSAALSPRYGPVFVDLPLDVQLTAVDSDTFLVPPSSTARHAPGPDPEAVKAVAQLLATARRPIIFAGSGAYWDHAETELATLARTLHAPLFVNGLSRGIVPADFTHLFTLSRREAFSKSDFILMLGGDFDFRLEYGRRLPDGARVVHVDPEPSRIGHVRPVDVGVVSDIRLFLHELLRRDRVFGRARARSWVSQLRAHELAKGRDRQAAMESESVPIHPMRLVKEVAAFLDRDAVVVADGGDIAAMAASVIKVDVPGHWLDPGPFGCLGVGVPFAMAARLSHPSKQVLAVFGDGAFGFNGFEYDSCVRQGLPFVGVIGNDGAWGEMRNFHERLFGGGYPCAHYLDQRTRYEMVVEGLGGFGERVERPDEIRPALERAAASGVASVVNVIIDPAYRRPVGTIEQGFKFASQT